MLMMTVHNVDDDRDDDGDDEHNCYFLFASIFDNEGNSLVYCDKISLQQDVDRR